MCRGFESRGRYIQSAHGPGAFFVLVSRSTLRRLRVPGRKPRSNSPRPIAREVLDHYNQAIEHLKAGDWAGFGTELDRLGGLLQDIGRQPVSH